MCNFILYSSISRIKELYFLRQLYRKGKREPGGRRGFTKVTEESGSKTQYDCEGRWSFGCCSSVGEHCQLKPSVLGSIPSYRLLAC